MIKEHTKKMIEVMQAYLDGKTIQVAYANKNKWSDIDQEELPTWQFGDFQYRIKPEPREWWIHINISPGGQIVGYISPNKTQAQELSKKLGSCKYTAPYECVHVTEVIE